MTPRSKLPSPPWPFPRLATLLAAGLAVASYLPIFAGRVPLPVDLLHYFPVWEGLPAEDLTFRHGELGDLLTLMYPWRLLLHDAWRSGTLPFWNPHSFAGSPFLANPVSAVFYPLNWLYAILPAPLAWSLQFPLRMALGAFFASLLARRLGASRAGALLAGAVFSMSGFMIGWQGWPQADVMLWVPLGMVAVLSLRRRPGRRSAALFALAIAPPVLAGHPEVCLYAVGAVAGFGLLQLAAALRLGRDFRWAARYAGAFVLGAVLAGGLCAVQLVPTIEWLPRITRGLEAVWQPRPARDVVTLVSRDTKSSPNSSGLEVPEESCYAGIGVLLLAPLALLSRRRGTAIFFALLGLVSLSVAFGLPPISQVFRSIPVLKALPGNRILGLLDLSLAMCAGLGYTVLAGSRCRSRSSLLAVALIAAASVGAGSALFLLGRRVSAPPITEILRRPAFSAVLLALSAFAAVAAVRNRDRRLGSLFRAAFAGLILLDVVTFSWRHVPLVPADAVYPRTATMDFLSSRARNGDRVLFLDTTAPRNMEIPYGLDAIEGYPQVLRQTARLLAPLNAGTEHDEPLRRFTADGVMAAGRPLLNRLGVRFLVTNTYKQSDESLARFGRVFPLRFAQGTVRIFENLEARPRVFGSESGRCTIEDFTARGNTVSGSVRCDEAGTIVVTQTFYPGWRAVVEGEATRVLPTDDGLCSFVVPSGQQRFRMEFRPSRFRQAVAMNLVALVVTALCLARRRGAVRR